MSIKVMSRIWDESKAEGSALLLLLAIADHCHDDGTGAWPSISRLASRTRQSERNTQLLLRHLQEVGELRVNYNAGPNGVNTYEVVLEGGEIFSPGEKQRQNSTLDFTRGVKNSAENVHQISPDPSVTVIESSLTLSGEPDNGRSLKNNKPKGGYHEHARAVLHLLNETCGRHFREVDANLSVISHRLREPDVTFDGVAAMISRQCQRWLNTPHEEFLRPETLFGKTKFDGYYAARDLPLPPTGDPKLAAARAVKSQFINAMIQ